MMLDRREVDRGKSERLAREVEDTERKIQRDELKRRELTRSMFEEILQRVSRPIKPGH